MSMPPEAKWLTVRQACAELQVGKDTLYRWLNEGHLKRFKDGRLVRIRRAELERFLAERERRKGERPVRKS